MSKEEDTKFLKIQTCVLKVNIHCDGCKVKVKKILHKVEGVYTTTIDAEHGKVTVSGDVDPETLIKKLVKNGKHAELITPKSTSRSSSINNNAKSQQQQQQQISNKFHNLQLGSGKCGQKENPKPQKAKDVHTVGVAGKSKGGQPSPTPPPPQPQQHKKHLQQVIKDAKPPTSKETPKPVKFDVPEDDGGSSEFDDELDDDDDDFDGSFDDDFDEDFEEDPKQIKPKPNNSTNVNTNPPVGAVAYCNGKVGNIPNAKKGDHGGGNEAKRGCRDGPNQAGLPKPNDFGGVVKDAKNVSNNAGGNRPGVMGPGVVAPMPAPIAQSMVNPNLPPAASVQGLLAGGSAYFHGAGAVGAPSPSGPNTAYHQQQQQQYLAAMMQQQQQQQQRMMMMMMNGQDRTFQPMVYARPPPLAVSYIPPPLPPEYSHFFSDENTTGGCAVM